MSNSCPQLFRIEDSKPDQEQLRTIVLHSLAPMPNPQIQTSTQPQIALQFAQASDRWHHRLIIVANDEATEFMSSAEGTPEEEWPPSPPLQEATLHELPEGNAILCVGMAGKSHWSAAYSIEPSVKGQHVRADLACLQKEESPSAKLGCCYNVNPDWTVKKVDNRVELAWRSLRVVLEPESETKLSAAEHQVFAEPTQFSTSPKVATRWRFRISNES